MKWLNNIANNIPWSSEISNSDEKQKVAEYIAGKVKDGDVIGFGSGSTALLAIYAIAKRIKDEGLSIIAIPTSHEISLTCSILGIPTSTLIHKKPDWGFDGADEVDSNGNLIKGRGGAMFAEKLVIASCSENYILVDQSKFVSHLGEKFPVPIEIDPRTINLVETRLKDFNPTEIKLRLAKGKDGPIITEAGNLILDVRFEKIEYYFEKEIKAIPGVIETGLFIGYNVNIVKA